MILHEVKRGGSTQEWWARVRRVGRMGDGQQKMYGNLGQKGDR